MEPPASTAEQQYDYKGADHAMITGIRTQFFYRGHQQDPQKGWNKLPYGHHIDLRKKVQWFSEAHTSGRNDRRAVRRRDGGVDDCWDYNQYYRFLYKVVFDFPEGTITTMTPQLTAAEFRAKLDAIPSRRSYSIYDDNPYRNAVALCDALEDKPDDLVVAPRYVVEFEMPAIEKNKFSMYRCGNPQCYSLITDRFEKQCCEESWRDVTFYSPCHSTTSYAPDDNRSFLKEMLEKQDREFEAQMVKLDQLSDRLDKKFKEAGVNFAPTPMSTMDMDAAAYRARGGGGFADELLRYNLGPLPCGLATPSSSSSSSSGLSTGGMRMQLMPTIQLHMSSFGVSADDVARRRRNPSPPPVPLSESVPPELAPLFEGATRPPKKDRHKRHGKRDFPPPK